MLDRGRRARRAGTASGEGAGRRRPVGQSAAVAATSAACAAVGVARSPAPQPRAASQRERGAARLAGTTLIGGRSALRRCRIRASRGTRTTHGQHVRPVRIAHRSSGRRAHDEQAPRDSADHARPQAARRRRVAARRRTSWIASSPKTKPPMCAKYATPPPPPPGRAGRRRRTAPAAANQSPRKSIAGSSRIVKKKMMKISVRTRARGIEHACSRRARAAIAPEAPSVGHRRVRADRDLQRERREPAEQVEDEELDRAHRVLDVVAEDPQEQHVAAEVQQPAVHEHRGERSSGTVGASSGRSSRGASCGDALARVRELVRDRAVVGELARVVRRARAAERDPALLPEEVGEHVGQRSARS